jgi:hypothetical protein
VLQQGFVRDSNHRPATVVELAHEKARLEQGMDELPRGWARECRKRCDGTQRRRVVVGTQAHQLPKQERQRLACLGANSLELHVGLGRATRVTSVRVDWPDAKRQVTTYRDLAMNRAYRIIQGDAPVVVERRALPFRAGSASTPASMH